MKRRSFLAATLAGSSALAGCGGRSNTDREYTETARPTPPADVTTETTVSVPEARSVDSVDAAVAFVEEHESRYVHNELVDGFGGSQPATDITVEPASASVVHTTEHGYYLLSACSGSADYYSAKGSSSASRNAVSVAHFVGGDTHRRVPFNFYSCAEPAVPTPTERRDDPPLARLQLYDFETPPDYENPSEGGHTVELAVRDDTGDAVLDRAYQTSLPLTVQPRVTDQPGEYIISAALDGADVSASFDWSLPGPEAPSWWAVAVIVTNAGGLTIQRLYPDETVGVPQRTLCDR
jgi:hypothetical protein